MFALLAQIALSLESTFCIYSKNKDACKNYGVAVKEKEIENLVKNPNKSYTKTTVYIAEPIIKEKLDIIPIKDAYIYIVGLKKDASIQFVSSGMSTYDFVSCKDIKLVKKDTTQFAIKRMVLENTVFEGFEKASCFYGDVLDTDLISVCDNTFKFSIVHVDVAYTKKFEPNWNVDGAIFCRDVTIMNMLDGSSIFQYGDQFIITPVNESMGFRRTNFRSIDSNGIIYHINHFREGANLTIGSWFANRRSIFSSMDLDVVNSTVHFIGYKWNTFNNISLTAINARVIVDEPKINLFFVKVQNSILDLCKNINIQYLYPGNIDNSTIKVNQEMVIVNVFLKGGVNTLNFEGGNVFISRIIGDEQSDLVLNGNSIFRVIEMKGMLGTITADTFLIQNVKYYFTPSSAAKLVAKNKFIPNSQKIKLYTYHSQKVEQYPEFIPLFEGPNVNELYDNLIKYTLDATFPCNVIIKDNQIGVTAADVTSTKSFNHCFDKDEKSTCGFPPDHVNTHTELMNLSDIIEFIGFPEELYKTINTRIKICNNLPGEIFIDSHLMKELEISSENFGNFTLDEDLSDVVNFTASGITLNGAHIRSKRINLFNTTLLDDIKVMEFGKSSLWIDESTYNQFTKRPKPSKLNIFTDLIKFGKDYIEPDVPRDSENIPVSFYGVRRVEGNGKFAENLTATIHPAPVINFTTNSYGNISFLLGAREDSEETNVIDVYYKAVLPVDLNNAPKFEFRLHPNFLGNSLEMDNNFCGKNMNVSLSGMEHIKFGKRALLCKGAQVNLNIPSLVEMSSSYTHGDIYVPKLTIDRMIYLENNTYIRVDEFSNPDDDFLLRFRWKLDEMPFFAINSFMDTQSSSYEPSIQTYAHNSTDDEFFHNHSVYRFGVPYICIYSSEYKGNIFMDGLLFTIKNQTAKTTTRYSKIAQEAANDVCAYIIPYEEQPPHTPKVGPEQPLPWLVTLAVCAVLFIALLVLIIISFIRGMRKKREESTALIAGAESQERATLMMEMLPESSV